MSIRSKLSCLVMLAAFTGMVGCQTGGASPAASMAAPKKGIVVTTANGVNVYVPTDDGKGVQMLSSTNDKPCPMCEKDAMTYFTTGKIIPVCSECHATRVPIDAK